jgi:hypothetical protein
VPSLFEPAGPDVGGLEVVENELAAPRAAAPPPRRRQPERVLEGDFPPPGATPRPADPEAPSRPERPALATPRPRGEPRSSLASGERVREPAPAAEAPAAVAAAAPEPASARPLVRAVPVTRAAAAATPAPAPAVEEARAEAPVVRVHIGRLEVRASVHEAPPPGWARERRAPPELALGDYLRGERTAR